MLRKVLLGCGITALALLYWFPVRRWFGRCGTTPDELTRVMPGDNLIANPTLTGTQAVTVDAPPDDIWPWLVQMGYQRGGGCTALTGSIDSSAFWTGRVRTGSFPSFSTWPWATRFTSDPARISP
jgi:hypothetical protein